MREHVWFDPAEATATAPSRRSERPPAQERLVSRPDPATSSSSWTPSTWRAAAAEALVARLAAAQAVHGSASVVLTGGGIGIAVLEQVAALAAEPVRETVDWTAVDVWWGDERFVPGGRRRAQREAGAAQALLTRVGVPEHRVHAMPPSDGGLRRARGRRRLVRRPARRGAPDGPGRPPARRAAAGHGAGGPRGLDLPRLPGGRRRSAPVVAVRDCPKPPPTRISLGFPAINAAEEVWLLVSGEAKAPAVAQALAGADRRRSCPRPGCTARRATRWLLDAERPRSSSPADPYPLRGRRS